MFRKLYFLIALISLASFVSAQPQKHIYWQVSATVSNSNDAEVQLKATIDKGWHLYSQYFDDGGPTRLEIAFNPSQNYELVGKVDELPVPVEMFDDIFGIKVKYFENKAVFTQKIRIKSQQPFAISGHLYGQICQENGACILTKEDFECNLSAVANIKHTAPDKQVVKLEATKNTGLHDTSAAQDRVNPVPALQQKVPSVGATAATIPVASLWLLFWISFLTGLAAIATPCVFPMIPMTVSFFMHGEKSKMKQRAAVYFFSVSIIAIYTVIGTIVSYIFGAGFANFLSTHWLPNTLFFVVFLIFAASFFGMFEIVLPSWLVAKADKQADKGGWAGPFFMAFTLVLVSFSCTGPIVGAVLVQSAHGSFVQPIVAMLGFSLAFALPFTLFALFPSWMSNMPKSGGWLNSVKVVLGFVELALGLKFLSIADLAYHWHLLDREVFLGFWIVIFFMLGLYLLGKLRFAHDSDNTVVSVPRLFLAIVTFSFVLYMVPGIWGAPLKALSGYLPPLTTQDFNIAQKQESLISTQPSALCEVPKYGNFLKMPYNIQGYFDINQAIACAQKTNKPIFLDFTGHGCANCRKMEENVWADERVLNLLNTNYIVVSLYVDDKTKLPNNQWVKDNGGKYHKTIGDINAYFQESTFKSNAQPQYVILNSNGAQLAEPKFFDLNADSFVVFLKKGINTFSEGKNDVN